MTCNIERKQPIVVGFFYLAVCLTEKLGALLQFFQRLCVVEKNDNEKKKMHIDSIVLHSQRRRFCISIGEKGQVRTVAKQKM